MDRAWKLGTDMISSDNVLDGFTFDDIILAVRCNCSKIDRKAVMNTAREILESRMEDYRYILMNNLDEIIAEVKKQKGV
ncbi:MAG: hypothetical protein J6S14_11965 [Clostridia bacterium]|nr:hypothetical protein [Clostridia bacterium]